MLTEELKASYAGRPSLAISDRYGDWDNPGIIDRLEGFSPVTFALLSGRMYRAFDFVALLKNHWVIVFRGLARSINI